MRHETLMSLSLYFNSMFFLSHIQKESAGYFYRSPIDYQSVAASDRKQAVLAYLEKHGQAKASEFADVIGLSDGRVRALLRDMVSDGAIEKVGDKRYAHYLLK